MIEPWDVAAPELSVRASDNAVMSTTKESALASLAASLQTVEQDPKFGPSSNEADVLDGMINYVESTADSVQGSDLAEVAYAFLAGYEHGMGSVGREFTRPAYAALRKAGMSL